MFINFAELYASGGTFDRQEVNTSSKDGTTIIYGGYSPGGDPDDPDIDNKLWLIRKLVVTESGGTQTITCTWAKAPWSERSNNETVYQFGKP